MRHNPSETGAKLRREPAPHPDEDPIMSQIHNTLRRSQPTARAKLLALFDLNDLLGMAAMFGFALAVLNAVSPVVADTGAGAATAIEAAAD
jgi:hypothetical protein